MNVYLAQPGDERARKVPGPADLQGKAGSLILVGNPDDDTAAYWATSVGLFVARGGSAEWRTRG